MIVYTDPQGTDAWLESRRGVITGSRCKDARNKLKSGQPSNASTLYAMDTARERCGGRVLPTYANAAMRMGTEQEPLARAAYETETGRVAIEAGFITTDDGKFGVSVDGLVDVDGMVEIKTMVSSDTLFTAVVQRDFSAYVDQINMALWLLGRKWCDLILWAPDLEPIGRGITIIRIDRDDDTIDALESDLVAFDEVVEGYCCQLRGQPTEDAQASKPANGPAPAVACDAQRTAVARVEISEPITEQCAAAVQAQQAIQQAAAAPRLISTQAATQFPFAGVDPKFCPGSNPDRPQEPDDTPPTLKLGTICGRLSFTVSADFMVTLGYSPKVEKGARLFYESDFANICQAISAHVLAVAHQHAGVTS